MKKIRVKDWERLPALRGNAMTPPGYWPGSLATEQRLWFLELTPLGYCPVLLAAEQHQKLNLKNPGNNKPTAFLFTSSTSYWHLWAFSLMCFWLVRPNWGTRIGYICKGQSNRYPHRKRGAIRRFPELSQIRGNSVIWNNTEHNIEVEKTGMKKMNSNMKVWWNYQ